MFFRRAFKAQGLSRDALPYKSRWQPFLAWYGFVGCILVMLLNGFYLFINGSWDTKSFIFCYFTYVTGAVYSVHSHLAPSLDVHEQI